jgi:tRNA 2-selenouridine synthase
MIQALQALPESTRGCGVLQRALEAVMTVPHRPLGQLESIPELTWVDVRSPREFARGRIPGAINLPILDDDDRARVGIAYHREGQMAAKRLGLEIVGPRFGEILQRYAELADRGPVALYCWRGGMRSGLLAQFLRGLGVPVLALEGGYRAFRRSVLEWLERSVPPLVVLHGYTGSGKTLILRRLAGRGLPVVDLEGIGHHRGSTFGDVGLAPQPGQADFEAGVVGAFRGCAAGPVLVEAESPALGVLTLPAPIVTAMRAGWRVFVDVPRELRVRVLVDEYAPHILADPACLMKPLEYLARRMPRPQVEELRGLAEGGELERFCELLLVRHYDPLYERWRKRAGDGMFRVIPVESLDEAEAAVRACFEEIARGLPQLAAVR